MADIVAAVAATATFFILLIAYVVMPEVRTPRVSVCYPGARISDRRGHGQEVELTFHVEHRGGLWGLNGEIARNVVVHCYFPRQFAIIEGHYAKYSFTTVSRAPDAGIFAGRDYVSISGFDLFPREAEEIFIKVKTPDITGSHEILFGVLTEKGGIRVSQVELIID